MGITKKLSDVWRRTKRYFASHSIFFHIASLILLLWACSLLVMLLWGIMVSCTPYRGELGYANNKAQFFPLAWKNNWAEVFDIIKVDTPLGNTVGYFPMLWNSVWISIGTQSAKIISATCFAYLIAKYDFCGKRFAYMFVIVQMMIPTYGQTSANYRLLDSLGMISSPTYLLSQFAGHGMPFLLLHACFVGIDKAYSEAAQMDGANDWTVLVKIMIPLALPIIGTLFLTGFIGLWNDYATILIFMEEYPTLASGLFLFQESRDFQGAPTYFAGLFISAIPVACLFLCFHKQLLSNLMIGGIKG